MMLVARWPNTSLNLSYPKKAYTTDAHKSGSGPYTGVLTCKTNPPAIDPTGCKIFFQPDTGKWSWSFSGRVQSISGNQLVFLSENGSTEDDKTDYADVCRYYIYDDLELLDQEGEWYHDQEDGILYLWVPGGGNPSTKRVEARKRVFAFDLSDRKYILIRGFELFGATITTDRVAGIARGAFDEDGFNSFPWPWRDDGSYGSSQHITIDSLTVLYPWHSMKMEYHFFMQYGLQSGIVLGGTDHIVQNCIIRYSSDNAISCNGYRHKIYNNLIEDIDYNGRGYSAVGLGANKASLNFDHEISYNTIRRCGRSGIRLGTLQNSNTSNLMARIHHNDISHVMLQDNDGAGLYGAGDYKFLRIDHNYIHDVNPGYINSGIYFDYPKNAIIHHNIIDNTWTTLQLTQTFYDRVNRKTTGEINMMIYNNTMICTNHPTVPYIAGPFNYWGRDNKSDFAPYQQGVVLKNNIAVVHEPPAKKNYRTFQNDQAFGQADMSHNINGGSESTMGFEDYEGDDFRLTSASTNVIDKGVVVQSATLDGVTLPVFNDPYKGSAPDIGAIEYGTEMWDVGSSLENPIPIPTQVKRHDKAQRISDASGFSVRWINNGKVLFNVTESANITLRILTLSGREVGRMNQRVQAGESLLPLSGILNGYSAKGMHILHCEQTDKTHTLKFIPNIGRLKF